MFPYDPGDLPGYPIVSAVRKNRSSRFRRPQPLERVPPKWTCRSSLAKKGQSRGTASPGAYGMHMGYMWEWYREMFRKHGMSCGNKHHGEIKLEILTDKVKQTTHNLCLSPRIPDVSKISQSLGSTWLRSINDESIWKCLHWLCGVEYLPATFLDKPKSMEPRTIHILQPREGKSSAVASNGPE